jgi:hypothetical protein
MIVRCWLVTCAMCVAVALSGCGRESPEPAAPAAGALPGAEVLPGAVKPYPLKVCLVSDEPLGSMGDPVVLVHEGQEVKFCCEGCAGPFKKDPAKYLAKLAGGKPAPDHTGHDHAGHDHAH